MVLLEAGDHEMLWPGVARTPKSPAGQQPRVPKWKPPLAGIPQCKHHGWVDRPIRFDAN